MIGEPHPIDDDSKAAIEIGTHGFLSCAECHQPLTSGVWVHRDSWDNDGRHSSTNLCGACNERIHND